MFQGETNRRVGKWDREGQETKQGCNIKHRLTVEWAGVCVGGVSICLSAPTKQYFKLSRSAGIQIQPSVGS